MSSLFTIGASTLDTAQRVMDMISQNVANANTPGYKQLVEHNSDVMYGNQPGGVTTVISQSGNLLLDNQLVSAMAATTQSDATREAMTLVTQNTDTAGIEKAYSAFQTAAISLQTTPNDPVAQTVFKNTGEEFSAKLKSFGAQFTDVAQQITTMRNLKQIQIDNLQTEMSSITGGNITDESKKTLEDLQKQVLMLSSSVTGYNQILNNVLPPISSMYFSSATRVIDNINTSYGKPLIDLSGNFTYNAAAQGNVSALVNTAPQQFGGDMGVLNVTIGSKMNMVSEDNLLSHSIYNNIQADVNATEGVDLVQQAIKMQKYQAMYNAGAKVLEVQGQMLGTLLNIKA